MMHSTLCVALFLGLAQTVSGENNAWNDFVSFGQVAAKPKGGIEAAQLAARRAGATAEALGPFAFSGQQIVINVDKTGTAPEQSVARPTTINTFIAGGETTELAIKTRIMQLCTNATLGTDATGGLTVFSGFATEAEKNKVFDSSNVNILPGVCTYCLTQGWGATDATPGFYVPCGCQRTCVDVSGNTFGNFMNGQKKRAEAGGSGSQPLAMTTCSDYLTNGIVASCTSVGNYHIVLWPSLGGSILMLYVAYTSANMQLDMDSLLYEPESAHKSD